MAVKYKRKARVLVTMRCNRNCPGCANEKLAPGAYQELRDLTQLLDYEEIMLSGGEPMLVPEETIRIAEFLRSRKYTGKLFLYTAYFEYTMYTCLLLTLIDGLTYTVHAEADETDLYALKRMTALLKANRRPGQYFRLSIDDRIFTKVLMEDINFFNWNEIRPMQWKKDCPIPEGEDLYLLVNQ
jgi:organic radical activating enzyme